jgi:hypothetical protein
LYVCACYTPPTNSLDPGLVYYKLYLCNFCVNTYLHRNYREVNCVGSQQVRTYFQSNLTCHQLWRSNHLWSVINHMVLVQ